MKKVIEIKPYVEIPTTEKGIKEIKSSHPKLLKVYVDLSNVCNYKCWYCFPGSNEGDSIWPDPIQLQKSITHLVNYYLESKVVDDIEIHFLGGEPTLWTSLGDVVQYISANSKAKVCIMTNGSRTVRWWKEYATYFHNIGISVHHEQCDVDKLIEVCNTLYDMDVHFHTVVLMDHTNWDKCIEIVDKLCSTEKKFIVLAKAIHIDGITSYTEEQQEYVSEQLKRCPDEEYLLQHSDIARKDYSVEFVDGSMFKTSTPTWFFTHGYISFTGYECNMGIENLFINKQGIVSGACGQHLYGLGNKYNIYDRDFVKNFKPVIGPVICSQPRCLCSGEAAITKKRLGL